MTIALSILAGLLLLIGFVGCVVPVLPGPIIGYCGLLALIPTEKRPSTLVLVTMGLVVASAKKTGSDYIVTRNTVHFGSSPVQVVTPADFAAKFCGKSKLAFWK